MKKGIFLILSLVSFAFLFAQTDDTQIPPPLAAPWEIVEVSALPGPIPYPVVRQNDVMWSVYIWREIDLREKRNHALYFPTEPQGMYRNLAQVILDAIDLDNPDNEDALPIYTNEDCNIKVDRSEIKNALVNTKRIPRFDPDTGEPIGEMDIDEPFTAAQVMYYRLKEVWFFDKNRGELSVRILSIEPFFEYERDAGSGAGNDDDVVSLKTKRRLGYIRYDELRPYLSKQVYFTPRNTALHVTFDDVLTWKRYFSSYVIAESNPQNREIQDYKKNPRDQRLESEKILNQIRNFESELWEY
ncbi:MAG: gliding motility protein GldN [Bacteroidetes bacterium]|nr:gliding motility protein GldN [Bacteroidota bacterium]MCL2303161.1 gliding motility protein GldN [Lentimicrobiaceae bacterium]